MLLYALSQQMSQPVSAAVNDEEVDIDLGDPEVQKAAVFIQSGFKGFKQRKVSQGLAKVDCLYRTSLLIFLSPQSDWCINCLATVQCFDAVG